MDTATFTFTNPGGHIPNEDALGFREYENGGIWVLADGLGGHVNGEDASNLAVKTTLEDYKPDREPDADYERELYKKLNQAINKLHGPKTTLVTAILKDGILNYANVGDSRLFFFHNGQCEKITVDQSVAYTFYQTGEIKFDEINHHEDRSRLLRALGSSEESGVQIYPEIKVSSGDAFLLCSDGFWEYVYKTEMEIDLMKSKTAKEWVEAMLLRLVRRITNDNDNFSATAVLVM